MNFSNNGSLNKNGKHDPNSEPKASQSNTTHRTTSLESVEKQTIKKSTNGTAKKQTKPYTHPHSIENILRKNGDARSLTSEHLQEAETSHKEERSKRQQPSIQHHVNLERPGPSQIQTLQTADPMEQRQATDLTTEASKQHLLRNKEPMPHQPQIQTATLSSKQHPQKKRQKIVFHQQYIPVMDLPQLSPQPQNSPEEVSLLNKELVLRRETPTTQQETYYTHLKLTKPQTQSQIQESVQTQLRKKQLSDQDISHFRLILPRDRQEQLALQQSLQENTLINISPNPQVQLPSQLSDRDTSHFRLILPQDRQEGLAPQQSLQESSINISPNPQLTSLEHQKECLPSYQTDQSNFESLDSIASQPPQSTNLLLNISSEAQCQTSSLNSSNQLKQSQTSLLNFPSQLPTSQISPFLSSSEQSQKETKPNSGQASRESVLPGDLKSLEVSVSQSPNLLMNISRQLTQSQNSQFLSYIQQSQKENVQLNHEQADSEAVLPSDLQLLEASDLTPEIDQTIEDLLDSYLTSCNKN